MRVMVIVKATEESEQGMRPAAAAMAAAGFAEREV